MTPKIIHMTTVDLSLRFLVFDCVKYLRSRGFDVLGVCAPGSHVGEVEQAGIRVAPIPMTRRVTPFKDLLSLLRLIVLLRKERPAVVHTHTPKANLLGQWAAWLAGVPIRIASVHGLYFTPETPLFKRVFFQAMERLSGRPAQVVFLSNKRDASTATSAGLYRPEKVRALPAGTGIDLARFDRSGPVDRPDLLARRRALGLPEDALVLGFVGRLVREKGLIELFQALRTAAESHPRLRALIVGPSDVDKPDRVSARTAHEHGAGSLCVFTGVRRDVADLYPLMDVFVLPSHREGMPLAAMEAQAVGLPVITTDTRGCRDVIVPEETGILVPRGDAAALAQAILRLSRDEPLRRRLGENARAHALKHFDQRVMFRAFEEEYRRCLEARESYPLSPKGRGARANDPLSLTGRGAGVRVV